MCRVKAMQAGLQTNESCWYLLRLCNLTTIQREWCALHAFPKLPFRDTLLTATAPDKPQKDALMIPEVSSLDRSHIICLHAFASFLAACWDRTGTEQNDDGWCLALLNVSFFLSSLLQLSTEPRAKLKEHSVCKQAVKQAMEAEYNDSQMAAVTAGLDRSPVILIQVLQQHFKRPHVPLRTCSPSLLHWHSFQLPAAATWWCWKHWQQ